MHYTILHLGSGQEVHEVKVKFHNRDRYYVLKTFNNIRQVRDYINRFSFYEDVNGVIVADISRWQRRAMATLYCSKHTMQAKQYVD